MKQIFTILAAFMLCGLTMKAQNGTWVTKAPVTSMSAITTSHTNTGVTVADKSIKAVLDATPTVDQPDNQVVCNNGSTLPVNFTGSVSGTSFSWTNDTPSIGIGISGTGNIPSFIATNATNEPVTATITVKPYTAEKGFAYIPNNYTNNVTVINTATNTVVGSPIPVGLEPHGISVSPDGARAYVINNGSNSVSVINTATNTIVGSSIPVGDHPYGIAVSPDGTRVYVTNYNSKTVSVINTATNMVVGSPIAVGYSPTGISVSVDGTRVYVADQMRNSVYVINTVSNTVVGPPIAVGEWPIGISVSPDGTRVYVVNTVSSSVSVINTASNTVVAEVFEIGEYPAPISVSPDGSRLYVAGRLSDDVCVINTATNTVVGSPISVGDSPSGISVSPDGTRVYVTNSQSNTVSVINTATNTVVGSPIVVGGQPVAFGNFVTGGVAISTGTAKTFTITVNPKPTTNVVATPSSQTICSETAITTIVLSGDEAGTIYNWTRENTVAVTGLAAGGSGDISGTLTNTTNAPVTVTFTISPTTNGCSVMPITATVTVNPTPDVVATPSSQTIYSGTAITTMVLSGAVAGTTYNWIRDDTAAVTGIVAVGSGDISGTLTNTTNNPVRLTFTITPKVNGCSGTPLTATVTVAPAAAGGGFAYITNAGSNNVSVINTATNKVVGLPIAVGSDPTGISVSPDGTRVYVANSGSNSISVINTATNTVVGSSISVGAIPYCISVSPDGTRLYVTRFDNKVSVINTATSTVVGSPIAVGEHPFGISVSPDGRRVYVVNMFSSNVSVINTATSTVVGSPIAVGEHPFGISVSPDGTRVYVANNQSNSVSVINTATNTVMGTPIPVKGHATGISISPDGTRVYVANNQSNSVSVINTATNTVLGTPIPVGENPWGISVSPDGTRVYVANNQSNSVSVINTITNTVVGYPIPVGLYPAAIGNFITRGNPATYFVTGNINYQVWENIGSSVAVRSLTSNINYPDNPTSSKLITSMEGETNIADNYGARITGYICAPATGSYTFWIASNNGGELWLSTNDNPANKQKIAYLTEYTRSREWNKYPTQKSTTINLIQGHFYYIEALMKESNNNDNLAVGWLKPGQTGTMPSEIIPGSVLSPYGTIPVSSVSLPLTSDLNAGPSVILPATVLPTNATNKDLIWTTSDPTVAIVNNNGAVTGLMPGIAIITATSTDGSNVSGTCAVTVTGVFPICSATGNITYQVWNNIGSSVAVSSLTSDINYPDNPTSAQLITSMEGATNVADNYGARIAGYICAPATGSYTFWIASNNGGELWLSTDDNSAYKQKIAYLTEYTRSREWNKYSTQKSATINLIKGHSYYIEALMKESNNNDNLAVGWLKPGQTGTSPSEVIPGSVLSPLVVPVKARESFVENPSELVKDVTLMVYPNPLVSDQLNIRLENLTSVATLRIYATSGVQCYEGLVESSGIIRVDRSVFKSGIYIIKVQNESFTKTAKLVVN